MKREYKDYIIDAIEKIEKFTQNMEFKDFECDDKTILAVVKSLEIIGEAAKKIPPRIKKLYLNVPWKKIAGMRDKLVHEYFGVNKKVVWRTAREDLPELGLKIKEIFQELERENKN